MSARTSPVYPDCVVQLTGEDANAFAIVAKVRICLQRHLRAQGMRAADIDRITTDFRREATSGDYSHLLATCEAWVQVQ